MWFVPTSASYLKIKSKSRLNAWSFGLNFPSQLAQQKRGGLSPSLIAPQISVKDITSNKWVGFRLAANQKLSNLLRFLPPSNLVAFLSILTKTVHTDCTIGARDHLSLPWKITDNASTPSLPSTAALSLIILNKLHAIALYRRCLPVGMAHYNTGHFIVQASTKTGGDRIFLRVFASVTNRWKQLNHGNR